MVEQAEWIHVTGAVQDGASVEEDENEPDRADDVSDVDVHGRYSAPDAAPGCSALITPVSDQAEQAPHADHAHDARRQVVASTVT